MARGYLQGNIFDQFFKLVAGNRAFLAGSYFNQNPDFCASVNVRSDKPVSIDLHARLAGNLDVLANFSDEFLDFLVKTHFAIGREPLGHTIGKLAKGFVASDKVSLAV